MTLLRDRIKSPQQLAVVGIERLDEPAHAVFAAVGSDQHLVVDDGRRHRFAVALLGIGDLRFPKHAASLRIERNQLGVKSSHENLAAGDRHAAVVRPAAERGDWTHLVLVVPELLASDRIDRINVVVRGRQVHHAVDDDRRGLHRLDDFGLEHERGPQVLDVAGVDLVAAVMAQLRVVAVGVQPVRRLLAGVVELRLRYRHGLRSARHRCPLLPRRLLGGRRSHCHCERDADGKCPQSDGLFHSSSASWFEARASAPFHCGVGTRRTRDADPALPLLARCDSGPRRAGR